MRETVVEVCERPCPAMVAESFLERLLGLHLFSGPPAALILPGSSVHGLGLRAPIWVIGLDEHGYGFGGAVLAPRRVTTFPGAAAVLEIPRGPACADEHRSHLVRWHR